MKKFSVKQFSTVLEVEEFLNSLLLERAGFAIVAFTETADNFTLIIKRD